MMFLVEKTFIDKETKKIHGKGTIYESEDEGRIEELKQCGFLGVELVVREDKPAEDKEPPTADEQEPPKEDDAKKEKKGAK